MTMLKLRKMIEKNEAENRIRVNNEIDKAGMAYKLKDEEGNEFVYAGMENGYPIYRTASGQKHIFQIDGYEIVEKYLA